MKSILNDRCLLRIVGLAACFWLVTSPSAHAHAFGQRYDLPLPLNLYLVAAAATVVLSFVIISIFARQSSQSSQLPRLQSKALGSVFASSYLRTSLRLVAVGLFTLTLLSGFIGTQKPLQNFAPTFIWVIFWVGLAFVSALIGNVWPVLNPWIALFEWSEALYQRITGRRSFALDKPYPQELGVWPAVILLLAFAWLELVWQPAQIPFNTASAALLYSIVTWSGMTVYGREVWLQHGEVFTVIFALFARFAPLKLQRDSDGPVLIVQPYAAGFMTSPAVDASVMFFVLMMLAILSFDGFKDTPLWVSFVERVLPPLLPLFGTKAYAILKTLALVGAPLLFFSIYLVFVTLMRRFAGTEHPDRDETARTFVFTLAPIVIAYHLSHYLSYLLIIGQQMIPLASDPFGFGWDLFGTAAYRIYVNIVGARFIWRFAVVAIVLGHVISIILAHLTALNTYPTSIAARRSQFPLLFLMVGYTMLSLWLFAQPIMESSS